MVTKDKLCVTVYLNAEEQKALQERMDYLQEKQGYGKITKTDAIRHAIMQTGYKRTKKQKDEDEL